MRWCNDKLNLSVREVEMYDINIISETDLIKKLRNMVNTIENRKIGMVEILSMGNIYDDKLLITNPPYNYKKRNDVYFQFMNIITMSKCIFTTI